jgi:ATP-binding cassette subfamily B protein
LFALGWSQASAFVKLRLAVTLGLVGAGAVVTATGPLALKFVVDGLTHATGATGASLTVLLGLYVLSIWLARALSEVRAYVHARAERRMARTMSDQLFGHVLRLPLRYHFNRQTGALTGTLTQALQGYQMILNTLVMTLLPVVIEITTVALVLVSLQQTPYLALFLVAMVCYGSTFTWGAVRVMGAARSAAASQNRALGVMTDSLLNYEVLKYFAAEDTVRARFDDSLAQTESEWIRFHGLRARVGLLVATIFAAFLAIGLLYAVHEVQHGRMTVGTFVLIQTYIFRLVQPLETIGYAMQQLSQGVAYLEKLLEVLREMPEPSSRHVQAPSVGPGRLEFRGVSVAYRDDRPTLHDVNFEIPAGQTLGVVGASGAGKSTLVRVLTRLIEPDSGVILLDGVPTAELPLPVLRQAIAVVPQDTVLFNDSISFNIGFGKRNSTQAEIEEAARIAHLDELIARLPEGYATRVGERGVKLSGGEKQRISIARAAIKRPRIYVFDEATSSLDTRTERDILQNLRELSQHATTLVIAHRLSTVVHADEIVVLDEGTIVERGNHASLLARDGRYAALWRAQQQQGLSRSPAIQTCE